MKRLFPGFLALGLTLLLAGSAHADPLTGTFGITGNWLPSGGANIVTATAIDFIACNGTACVPPPVVPVATPGTPGGFLVTSATGDFGASGLNLSGLQGSIKDFTFSGAGSANFPNVPVNAFEIVSLLSFDLNTVSIVNQNLTCGPGGAACLQLSGTGVFHATGFDDTFGTWTFLGSSACAALGCPPAFIETFVFTSLNTAVPPSVPEPSLLVLIGLGLVGLAAWGRVRMRNPK